MWKWGRGDSSLWNQGGHLGDTLTEMVCLSGHTATGTLPSCKRLPALPGRLGARHIPVGTLGPFGHFFGGSPTSVLALGGA